MRPLEVTLLIGAAVALASLSFRTVRRPEGLALLASLVTALAGWQIGWEGYRWQMIPAYVLSGAAFLFAAWNLFRPAALPRVALWIGWLLAAAALVAGSLFPVFQFPRPTGPYAIGTEIRHLVDRNRTETLGTHPGGPRELMIQLWYPAKVPPGAAPERYLPDKRMVRSLEDSQLTLVRTHSFLNAPPALAAAPFPVIIFSPSWQGERYQNTFQFEDLASHGFVVVAIDHPYITASTLFPDGRVVTAPSMPYRDYSSDKALHHSAVLNEKLTLVRTGDIEFVANTLNHLGSGGSPDRLDGHLDLNRLGALGYSFGGGSAAEACRTDPRFRAGVDLDGAMFAGAAELGVEQPFLFLDDGAGVPWADFYSADPDKRRYAESEKQDADAEEYSVEMHGGYRLQIAGTEHINFTDTALFSPLHYITGAGSIAPRRAMQIINAYTLAFFEKYLNGKAEPLLDGPSHEFPEVQFRHLTPGGSSAASGR